MTRKTRKRMPGRNHFSERLLPRVRRILIFLFIFFLPTQLGKHFFLPFSYISGVRIDYLAPTVYLTDMLAFLLILTSLDVYRTMLRNKTVQKVLFLLSLTLVFAISRDFGLYKFLKVIELFAVGAIFLSSRADRPTVFSAFFFSTLLQAYIVILQLIFRHSLNGDFYFLGERPLTLSLPGVAKAGLDGVQMLRPYGTFSHPNSMAGFFLVIYSYYLFNRPLVNKIVYWFFMTLLAFLVIISFSKSAILIFFLVTLYFIMRNRSRYTNKPLRFIFITIVIFICSLFFRATTDPLTISKRLTLTLNSLQIIKANPLLGVGLGSYLYAQADFPQQYASFILQPVHNIFLLLMAEIGVPISIYFIYLLITRIRPLFRTSYFIPFFIIIATGMVDHYWLTLQQNWLLLGVIYGMVNRGTEEQIK